MATSKTLQDVCDYVTGHVDQLNCRVDKLMVEMCNNGDPDDNSPSPSPDAGECQPLVVAADPDGAWSFFSSRIGHVFDSKNMLIGFVDEDGYSSDSFIDYETQEVSKSRLATSAQADDHNEPSFIKRRGDGMILAAYTRHVADNLSNFRVSLVAEPQLIADWGPEVTIDHGGTLRRSYNQLNYVGGRLFNIIRAGQTSPNQAWYVMYSDDDGDTWSALFRIHANLPTVSPSQQDNCYCQSVGDDLGNKLWIAANDGFPNHGTITTSQYCYYIEATTLTMHNPDGTLIGPIGTPFDLETETNASGKVYVYSAPVGRAWNWDIKLDEDGDVYVAYQTEILTNPTGARTDSDRIFYYTGVWNGLAWTNTFLGHAGYGISSSSPSYGGGLTLNPNNPAKFLFSSNSEDPNADVGSPPDLYERWLIYEGTIGSDVVSKTSAEQTIQSYFRPRIFTNDEGFEVTFVMHGEYTNWSGDYDAVVEAWFCGFDSNIEPPIVGQDHNVVAATLVLRAGKWTPLIGTGVVNIGVTRVLMPGEISPDFPLRGPVPEYVIRVEHNRGSLGAINITGDELLETNGFSFGPRIDTGFFDIEMTAPVVLTLNLRDPLSAPDPNKPTITNISPWVDVADFAVGLVDDSDPILPVPIGLPGQVWLTFPTVQVTRAIQVEPLGGVDPTQYVTPNPAANFLYIAQQNNIAGSVEYDGADWVLDHNIAVRSGASLAVQSFAAGVLTIRHFAISANLESKPAIACVKGASPYTLTADFDDDDIIIRWYDDTGTLVTVADTDMKASFFRPNTLYQSASPRGQVTVHLGMMRIKPDGLGSLSNPNFFVSAIGN